MARIREENHYGRVWHEGPLSDYLEQRLLQRVDATPKTLARFIDMMVDRKVLSLEDLQSLFGYDLYNIELVNEETE